MANNAQAARLAAMARAAAGTAQQGAVPVPAGADGAAGPVDLMRMLRSGQFSSGALMKILALLAGLGGLPGQQMPQSGPPPQQAPVPQGAVDQSGAAAQGMSPIQQALMGQ